MNQAQQQEYQARVKEKSPKPPLLKNCLWAFGVGGMICLLGQFIQGQFINSVGLAKQDAATATSILLVFLGTFFTGLGVYDELGKRAGAGSVVPITGFANSVAAPALEFKREGYVLGVGAKIFVVAGPVILYGTVTAFLVGVAHLWLKGG
ncbi:MAG: stage V sporulation protein AC [Sporomusaceae bacterium]|nr:stage V sporulation protein AC [Sporomusaceae bacterium]